VIGIEPKLSVCLITYNHERYIELAVQSALAQQTAFPFEIVVGEDCSTDRTRDILLQLKSQHPDRIRLSLRERNVGAMAHFAQRRLDCRGQYLAILEGDDYWTDPAKLQKQVEALDAHPDWTIAFHRVRCVYEDGSRPDHWYPATVPRDVLSIDDMIRRNFIQSCSAVYRNHVIERLPEFFADLKLGDWPFALMHADRGHVGYLPDEMAVYRIHGQGLWTLTSEVSRYRATLEMLTQMDRYFDGRYHRQFRGTRRRLGAALWLVRCRQLLRSLWHRLSASNASFERRKTLVHTEPEKTVRVSRAPAPESESIGN
jgi:glycosyltransferase involved in cell wall biosynthesis